MCVKFFMTMARQLLSFLIIFGLTANPASAAAVFVGAGQPTPSSGVYEQQALASRAAWVFGPLARAPRISVTALLIAGLALTPYEPPHPATYPFSWWDHLIGGDPRTGPAARVAYRLPPRRPLGGPRVRIGGLLFELPEYLTHVIRYPEAR